MSSNRRSCTPGAYFKTASSKYFGGPWVTVGGVFVDPSAYAIAAPNTITFATAPASGVAIAWSGAFAYECRFLDDQIDFENFMSGLWRAKGLRFRQVR